jgi:hypothetical protein
MTEQRKRKRCEGQASDTLPVDDERRIQIRPAEPLHAREIEAPEQRLVVGHQKDVFVAEFKEPGLKANEVLEQEENGGGAEQDEFAGGERIKDSQPREEQREGGERPTRNDGQNRQGQDEADDSSKFLIGQLRRS